MSTIIDGTTGITTDGLSTSGTITANGLIIGTGTAQLIKLETAKATTSGTTVDFTGIPSWAKKITVMFNGVSTNGTSKVQIQLGDSGGIETSGYLGTSANVFNAVSPSVSGLTSGFINEAVLATNIRHGLYTISLVDTSLNLWTCFGAVSPSDTLGIFITAGSKTLSSTLDRIRITTVNGTDTFDAGSVNILIEGSLQ